ncbi:hypothetical protein BDR04DRAFT_1105298 [Suillus decipiens]|nr:hypothetical protein BDR04DRAFT_1105298 [Suillus decipiens]
MLSKSFALFAAFAAAAPALASPLPNNVVGALVDLNNVANDLHANVLSTRGGSPSFDDVVKGFEQHSGGYDYGCSVVQIDAIINNVLNNATINILSTKRSGCDVLGVTAVVENVLNNLKINILSSGVKRDVVGVTAVVDNVLENPKINVVSSGVKRDVVKVDALVNNVANNAHVNVASTKAKRGQWDGCSLADVTAVITNVANNANINVLSSRGECDLVSLGVFVKNVLNNLNVNVLSTRSADAEFANPNDLMFLADGVVNSVVSGGLPRRDVVDVLAVVENVANNLNANVAST